jgi:hypothetical protein
MPRGTCWKGYVQKGMKMKNGRSVPNCVPVQKAYLGKAIKQPSETNAEFKIRHEMHTPFMDLKKNKKKIVKAQVGKEIKKISKTIDSMYNVTGRGVDVLSTFNESDKNKLHGGPMLLKNATSGDPELGVFAIKDFGDDYKGSLTASKSEQQIGLEKKIGKGSAMLSLSRDEREGNKGMLSVKIPLGGNKAKGGIIKGKPKLALRGWK